VSKHKNKQLASGEEGYGGMCRRFVRGESSSKFFSREIVRGECLMRLSGVSVRVSRQDYNSLPVAVMIWATLVNTQTHTQTEMGRQTDRHFLTGMLHSISG